MSNIYNDGTYLDNNPTWHVEDSQWKASQILKMLEKHNIKPKTICEVGCGAGEILSQMQNNMDRDCTFFGYDISPQAFEICKKKENDKLKFYHKDIIQDKNAFYEILLLVDVIEHIENYYEFLKVVKTKSNLILLHIPLDICVFNLLRNKLILLRKNAGHIHFFLKETALYTLKEIGFDIVDYFYTPKFIDLRSSNNYKSYILSRLMKSLFTFNRDFTVKLLGGYSLLVLAK